MASIKTIALVGAAAAALSACSHSAKTIAVANQDHREIKARETTRYYELGARSGFLTSEERRGDTPEPSARDYAVREARPELV